MRSFAFPADLTPDERLAELADILAAGVLRLRARAALSGAASGEVAPKESDRGGVSCLEVPTETVLSVHDG